MTDMKKTLIALNIVIKIPPFYALENMRRRALMFCFTVNGTTALFF